MPTATAACIMDTASTLGFQNELRYLAIRPSGWQLLMERERPNFLLVESAWHGNNGLWRGMIAGPTGPQSTLRELICWCRQRGIPTVFWNKDDPHHIDRFMGAAALFDYVFTVDDRCVDRHRRKLGHHRIGVLPFAVQPRLFNPIVVRAERPYDVAFVGADGVRRDPDPEEKVRALLEPALRHGVRVFDRPSSWHGKGALEAYAGRMVGKLNPSTAASQYKQHQVCVDYNETPHSRSRAPRRIFEILATGTNVVTNTSRSTPPLFGNDGVCSSAGPTETAHHLERLLHDNELRDRQRTLGLRTVLSRHTYAHRLERILAAVGTNVERADASVSVVAATNRANQVGNIISSVARQEYQPLELVLVLHGLTISPADVQARATAAGIRHVKVITVDRVRPLGFALNAGAGAASGRYVAKFDDDDYYSPCYLTDLVHAFSYTDAGVVGKLSFYIYLTASDCTILYRPGHEHQYVDWLAGPTLVMKKEVWEKVRFPNVRRGEISRFLRACLNQGVKLYSTDRFNFTYVRSADPADHTSVYPATDQQWFSKGPVQFRGRDFARTTV